MITSNYLLNSSGNMLANPAGTHLLQGIPWVHPEYRKFELRGDTDIFYSNSADLTGYGVNKGVKIACLTITGSAGYVPDMWTAENTSTYGPRDPWFVPVSASALNISISNEFHYAYYAYPPDSKLSSHTVRYTTVPNQTGSWLEAGFTVGGVPYTETWTGVGHGSFQAYSSYGCGVYSTANITPSLYETRDYDSPSAIMFSAGVLLKGTTTEGRLDEVRGLGVRASWTATGYAPVV